MVIRKSFKNFGFWSEISRPFFVLAPMADVTDFAFREMFAKYSKPHLTSPSKGEKSNFVMFTEFVSVDGLCSAGRKNLIRELKYSASQRPIVAQIWGVRPQNFYKSALFLKSLKFDGIDINMGCPQRKEVGLGACAALIKQPKLAQEIILATKKGAGRVPVSVKTRIGFEKNEVDKWVGTLLSAKPAAITLHGRTARELSKVPANWVAIARAVEIRKQKKSSTLIIGNGDVRSLAEAKEKAEQFGVDGVMIGRGVFGNPWFFAPPINIKMRGIRRSLHTANESGRGIDHHNVRQRLEAMLEHARIFTKTIGKHRNFAVLRKHFKAYASGFDGAATLRVELMKTESLEETEQIVKNFLKLPSEF